MAGLREISRHQPGIILLFKPRRELGAKLKFAGYDGIIIQGESEKTVYLLVEKGNAKLKDASHLRGKGAVEVREILRRELGAPPGS